MTVTNFVLGIFGFQKKSEPLRKQLGQSSLAGSSRPVGRSSQPRRHVHFEPTPPRVVPRKRAVVFNNAVPTSSSARPSKSSLRLSGSNLRLLDTSNKDKKIEKSPDWSTESQRAESDDDDTVLPAPTVSISNSRRLRRTDSFHQLNFDRATPVPESDKTPGAVREATPGPSTGAPLAPSRVPRRAPQTVPATSPSPQVAAEAVFTFKVRSKAAAPAAGLSMIEQLSSRPALLESVTPSALLQSQISRKIFPFGASKDAKSVESSTKATTSGNETTSAFQFGGTSHSEFSFKFILDETAKTEAQKTVSLANNVSPPCPDVSHLAVLDLFATSELTESKVQTVRYGLVIKQKLCLLHALSGLLDMYDLSIVDTTSGDETRLDGNAETLVESLEPKSIFIVALRRKDAKGQILADWPQLKQALKAAIKGELGEATMSLKRLRDNEDDDDSEEGSRKLRRTETAHPVPQGSKHH
ncbi:hypothetical protein C8J56DRAFT_149066 [Mycena floridula]|nr:hypothetical protein C8J56DRAFT_149066 [Mycena floridula]